MNRGIGAPEARLSATSKINNRVLVAAAIGALFILRLVYCLCVELLPEETYYWNWAFASHLDIGYFDHPPMVAWLIRAWTYVLGDTEIGVRSGALMCSVITSVFVYRLTDNLFGEAAARFALLLAQILPFFFLSGILMTPDAPLSACWAATLYFFERALIAGRSRAWVAAGLTLGLGLLSKYTIALLGFSAAVFLLIDPPSRQWLRRFEPYAAALLAAIFFAPVILWNVQHEWASFAFQTVHRLAERPQFALHKLIAASLILISPTGVWAACAAFTRRLPATAQPSTPNDHAIDPDRRWLFLRVMLLLPLGVFASFSLRHEIKLDWMGVVWLAALPAMGAYKAATDRVALDRVAPSREICGTAARLLSLAWPLTLCLLVLCYCVGVYALATGVPHGQLAKQPELVPIGWHDLADQIDGIAQGVKTRNALLIVGMDRYATASELTFYSRDQLRASRRTTAAHLFGGTGLMYELWFPKSQLIGRDLLLVSWNSRDVENQALAAYAQKLEPLQSGTVSRNGKAVRPFYYRVLRGYRTG